MWSFPREFDPGICHSDQNILLTKPQGLAEHKMEHSHWLKCFNFVSFGFTLRSLFYAHFYTRVLPLDLTQIGGSLFGSMLRFGSFGFTLTRPQGLGQLKMEHSYWLKVGLWVLWLYTRVSFGPTLH